MAAAVSKLMRMQDLVAGRAQVPGRHALPQHARPAGPALDAAPAEPSDRRPAGHRRQHPRRPAVRQRRRGHRHQPGDRQRRGGQGAAARCWTSFAQRYEIPTQICVLAHVTTHARGDRRGAPVDLVFQSIAGTEAANASFGVDLALLDEARDAALALKRGTRGRQRHVLRDRPGQRASASAHHGVDQQTCEARAYAVARRFEPLLVNTVVGFIGPEYLYDGKQIIRAGLEDHFCGKLLGLPMGCDVCYTNHAEADQDDMDTLLTLLGVAGCTYIMGVPGADDVMLNYQSTSFHDALLCARRCSACGPRRSSRRGSRPWA